MDCLFLFCKMISLASVLVTHRKQLMVIITPPDKTVMTRSFIHNNLVVQLKITSRWVRINHKTGDYIELKRTTGLFFTSKKTNWAHDSDSAGYSNYNTYVPICLRNWRYYTENDHWNAFKRWGKRKTYIRGGKKRLDKCTMPCLNSMYIHR
jgi:hypothetical protein